MFSTKIRYDRYRKIINRYNMGSIQFLFDTFFIEPMYRLCLILVTTIKVSMRYTQLLAPYFRCIETSYRSIDSLSIPILLQKERTFCNLQKFEEIRVFEFPIVLTRPNKKIRKFRKKSREKFIGIGIGGGYHSTYAATFTPCRHVSRKLW